MGDANLPGPFRQFVVKLHSRCNLSCRYCYVYHHIDQTWRDRPAAMTADTAAAVARRIGDHARRHALGRIVVVLHGGEPLLAGPRLVDFLVTAIRAETPAATRVDVTVQTNGILLDEPFLEVLHRHRISVGVSVDGGRAAHDRHRRFADGRPSFDVVRAALLTLGRPEHRPIYGGLLCVIDLANEPVALYEDLLAFAPPRLDLSLPHGNWAHPPPGRSPDSGATPYADWLIAVFDRWYAAPRRETGIRLFEALIAVLVGGSSQTEAVGLDPTDAVTVETDGTLEGPDALKTTVPGAAATGLDVRRHSFDDARFHVVFRSSRRGLDALGPRCRACPVVDVCGGGLHAHRYGADGSFRHPSVYCADLYRLIGHVRGRLEADLRERAGRRSG